MLKIGHLEAFVERIGGPQFLTDFDETWTNFFGRSISKISTVHFFYFLPHFFTKGLNVQLSVKITFSDIWLPNIAFYKKTRQKSKKVNGRNSRYWSSEEIASGFIKIDQKLRSAYSFYEIIQIIKNLEISQGKGQGQGHMVS